MAYKTNLSNGIFLLLIICVIVLLASSCRSTDGDKIKSSHFYTSVHGPTMNGEFRIEDNENVTTLNFTGLIFPATENSPAIAVLVFNNYEGFGTTIQVPAKEQLSELTDNHDHFVMTMVSDMYDIILISKSLSINVTRFKSNNFGITEMRANFEGIMVYKKNDNTEESHTVKGEFEFYTSGSLGIL